MSGLILFSAITSLLEAFGISIVLPIFSRLLSVDSLDGGKISQFLNTSGLFDLSSTWLLVAIPIIFALKGVVSFAVGLIIPKLAMKIEINMRSNLMSRIFATRWETFHHSKSGSFVNVLNKECQSIVTATKYFCRFITDLAEAFILLSISLVLSPIVVALGILAGILSLMATHFLILRTHRLREQWVDVDNHLNSIVIENIDNAKLIKIMDRRNSRFSLFLGELNKSAKLRISIERYKAFLDSYQEPVKVGILSVAVVIILNSASLNNTDSFVSLLLLYRATGRLLNLQSARRTLAQTIPSVSAALKMSDDLDRNSEALGGSKTTIPAGDICFRNISYGYSPNTRVLDNVNFFIPEKQLTALVGRSGAGKTTITDLILGLIEPTHGEIIRGRASLDNLNKALWRKRIGFVPQDTALFNNNILSNIDMGRSLSQEELINAAKAANAHEFIEQLEYGYETVIGDRGIRLSGGQRQRLSLARALAGEPDLIILDEATNALDQHSEHDVRAALNNLKDDFTILVIAHNLQFIDDADQILFVCKQTVIQAASVAELIASSEEFSDFYRYK